LGSAQSVDVEEERLSKLLSELEGKDVNELISEGSSKLASVPSGGGGGGSAAPAAGGAAAAAGGAAEEKKEEKKEEEKEEVSHLRFELQLQAARPCSAAYSRTNADQCLSI
jgi:large subunit ribosomal protein LP2